MKPFNFQCVGRDDFIRDIIVSARRDGAVLLFGGRQSGKTTTLLHLSQLLDLQPANSAILSDIDVAIYVDLMTLPYDASPSDFFELLFHKTLVQCKKQITGFQEFSLQRTENFEYNLDTFIELMVLLKKACGEVNAHLMFLLDESKRVLGDRFPRGFQDNLFTLLYGESISICPPISMIFAGAQHLYLFAEDDTSPIGSRASYQFVKNLTSESVQILLLDNFPALVDSILDEALSLVMRLTGGHAGLVSKLIAIMKEKEYDGERSITTIDLESEITKNCFGLFENWALSLSSEARTAWGGLVINQEASISSISKILHRDGKDRFLAQRTLDELQYMGLAAIAEGKIYKVNEAFSIFANDFAIENDFVKNSAEVPLWKLIEETELALREIIKNKYNIGFGAASHSTMATILGSDAWTKIGAMQKKSLSAYPYSRVSVEREILSCMYFGNLMSLMISNKAWNFFKKMFKDKRQVEDIINAIIPVRNDSAHFATVPSKEMARCQVCCDDLLVIIERELEAMARTETREA